MFKHLLIPLDGSRLAEAALPAASYLAQTLGASVTLVHVIERDPPHEVHGEPHLTDEKEAGAYLEEVAARAFPPSLCVERHVHTDATSDIRSGIAMHVGEFRADLIVMCTHGRGGLRSRLFGSVAQQVIALGVAPVLLLHPNQTSSSSPFACRRLLVPLDGDPDHEQGIRTASDLARVCGADLHLLMVVRTLGTLPGEKAVAARLLPGATLEALELSLRGAAEYLGQQVAQMQGIGLAASAEVQRGDPVHAIIQTARQVQADLIVLGTHGKTGLSAFWAESTAPRIADRAHIPLLIVPVISS
jgi:nucleotide-binding universal stress UspA family protein